MDCGNRAISSVGRAPHSHCGGRRFESDMVHYIILLGMSFYKYILLIAIALFLCLAAILFSMAKKENNSVKEIYFRERCFRAEVVETMEQRAKGLMGRDDLAENQGMLFVFPEPGLYGFWMKNMLISIDIIWLDKDLAITHIEHSVPPCEADPCPAYNPHSPSQYVLEIRAGLAQELEMKTGDKFYFKGNGD